MEEAEDMGETFGMERNTRGLLECHIFVTNSKGQKVTNLSRPY